MKFDVTTIQFALWLLPLPLLLFHVGGTGLRKRWAWGQIASLSAIAVLELLTQAGSAEHSSGWLDARKHIWVCLGLLTLSVSQAESIANALDRGLGRRHRSVAAGITALLLFLAAFLPDAHHSTILLLGASATLGFHEVFASLLPGPLWQRALRALIVFFFASFLFLPAMLLPLANAVVLAVVFDTVWLLRRESLQRLARARESLKPQALKELFSSTSQSSIQSDEDSIPIERIQALLAFAVQGTNAAGGAVFLFRETTTPADTVSRRLSCVAAQGSIARLARDESESSLSARSSCRAWGTIPSKPSSSIQTPASTPSSCEHGMPIRWPPYPSGHAVAPSASS